jgi:hypothetical protein
LEGEGLNDGGAVTTGGICEDVKLSEDVINLKMGR